MSLSLFFTLLIILTATTGTTTTSPENLISSLKSKNITSVHLISPNPETISLFSHSNISLLLSIPNELIPSFSSNSSATSAWLLSHVTPFIPHVRISAISVGNNVTDATLLKLVVNAVENVKIKVKELGIERVNVSTAVSLGFVTGTSESVAKGLLSSLGEKGVTSLFVSTDNWNVSLGSSFKQVVCSGFALKGDLSTDVSYVSLGNNGEMMDYGVVQVKVLKATEDKVKKDDDNHAIVVLQVFIGYIIIMLNNLQSAFFPGSMLMLKFKTFLLVVFMFLYSWYHGAFRFSG